MLGKVPTPPIRRASIDSMPSTPHTITTTSRREFCASATAALALAHSHLLAQPHAASTSTPTRPDVAAIDHERILAMAARYLAMQPTPLTSLPSHRSPGTPHDFYSESESPPSSDAPSTQAAKSATPPFTAHRDALFTLGLAVPALAAAYLLTGEDRYAAHAAMWLRTWFVDPATRMTPRMDFGQVVVSPPPESSGGLSAAQTPTPKGRFEGILDTIPLAEVAIAIPFLATSPALTDGDRAAINAWFAAYLRWLTEPQDSGPRLGALARDQKSHHGSSWLLQVAAYSLLTAPESTAPKAEGNMFVDLRHRFRTVTLRAQINTNGEFPHELPSPTPYRDSLFNLDLLAGVCQLLSTRFESVWDYELEDGPGMRSVIAYHFPFIANRGLWPFRADTTHFDQLPGRRASLLFTARAYQRPEYATLWTTLPADPTALDILRTLPIHQPLLWIRQPPHA
jgi:Alginate lyase